MTDFGGKTVFVTGSGSGMALRCTEMFLDAGARVVGLDLKFDSKLAQRAVTDKNLILITGDASDAAVVRNAIDQTVERFGRLDVGVNAAGITGVIGRLVDQADDGLDRLLAINVRGVFLAMKYEALAMQRTGGGSIVNFASIFAQGSIPSFVLYGATKHAVVGLTEGAAVELAEHNIRVNAVAPGPIYTPFIGVVTPEVLEGVERGIPQRRIGQPDEVAHAVLWLLSQQATYVTGATLNVDGGQAARLA